MFGSLSVRFAVRAFAEPAAGQDSNGMHRRHRAPLGSRTGGGEGLRRNRSEQPTYPRNDMASISCAGQVARIREPINPVRGSGCRSRGVPSIGVRVRMLRCGPDLQDTASSMLPQTCYVHSYCRCCRKSGTLASSIQSLQPLT